ncbi:uncharacterized protein G2W53_012891 [Senna tora]|uniref:Uncharacterized protein n=1 Tax=Senna tora TaxID=362788 RepID=A0A834TXS9_9FABA|nr:uncharacterized protein G2W53_012891 [Senna tora]
MSASTTDDREQLPRLSEEGTNL